MVARPRAEQSAWRFEKPAEPANANRLARHFAVIKAIRHSFLTSAERHVLRSIEDHADNETGWAYPGVHTICRETGLSLATVHRALRDLTTQKASAIPGAGPRAVWLVRQMCSSKLGTNRYRVTPPGVELSDEEPPSQRAPRE